MFPRTAICIVFKILGRSINYGTYTSWGHLNETIFSGYSTLVAKLSKYSLYAGLTLFHVTSHVLFGKINKPSYAKRCNKNGLE